VTRQERVLVELTAADVRTLHGAWLRLEAARADERAAALADLCHLCSELGLLQRRQLTLVPESG
jgi:hypothetical protein